MDLATVMKSTDPKSEALRGSQDCRRQRCAMPTHFAFPFYPKSLGELLKSCRPWKDLHHHVK
jgi:hypothetical protein